MKILVLAGTGAMGAPLTEYLSRDEYNSIYVVSRHRNMADTENVHYIEGNANNLFFFKNIISKGYDIIIDFMIWEPQTLQGRRDLLFENCKQYIAMGTSAEYKDEPVVTEETGLLVDSYSKSILEQTKRYHVKKSLDVKLIKDSGYSHWTIVRPCVNFSVQKNKLVTIPANVWLWRCQNNKTIILPKEVMKKRTATMFASDAALCISKMVGNPKALGQVINIAPDLQPTWEEVIDLYQQILWNSLGKVMKIYYLPDASLLWRDIPSQYDPLVHDRFYDRYFSNKKLRDICGDIHFGDMRESLKKCIDIMLHDPTFSIQRPNPELNAWMDRMAGEFTPSYIYNQELMKRYKKMRSNHISKVTRLYRHHFDKSLRYLFHEK